MHLSAEADILKSVISEGTYRPDRVQGVADTLVRYGAHAGISAQELAFMLKSGMTVSDVAAHFSQLLMP
jgi:hypothetical protein